MSHFLFNCPVLHCISLLHLRRSPSSTLFPYTTLFRSDVDIDNTTIKTAERKYSAKLIAVASGPTCHTSKKMNPDLNDERSEEHTSELQSRENLVCRLLLEKKKHIRRPSTRLNGVRLAT